MNMLIAERPAPGLAVVVAALLSACEPSERRLPPTAGPERLDGIWSVEFQLEQSPAGRPDPSQAEPVRGEMVLIANDWLERAAGLSGTPTHYGAYAADFSQFGFEPRPGGRVPVVAARLIGTDSVEVSLAREREEERFVMYGRLAGESISGRWSYQVGRVAAFIGRFVMRRG